MLVDITYVVSCPLAFVQFFSYAISSNVYSLIVVPAFVIIKLSFFECAQLNVADESVCV